MLLYAIEEFGLRSETQGQDGEEEEEEDPSMMDDATQNDDGDDGGKWVKPIPGRASPGRDYLEYLLSPVFAQRFIDAIRVVHAALTHATQQYSCAADSSHDDDAVAAAASAPSPRSALSNQCGCTCSGVVVTVASILMISCQNSIPAVHVSW